MSEVLALTLGDWQAWGLRQTACARNKGSRQRRAKFVRFSPDTAKLLRRYADTARAARGSPPRAWGQSQPVVQPVVEKGGVFRADQRQSAGA